MVRYIKVGYLARNYVMKRLLGCCFILCSWSAMFGKGCVYIISGDPDVFNITTMLNRDEVRRPLYDCKVALERLGYTVKQAKSINNLVDVEKIICFAGAITDCRDLLHYPYEARILVLWEPESVFPSDYEKSYHDYFSKIYTWKDDLVDNKRYFKFYDPQPRFDVLEQFFPFEQKILSVLLTCNKHYSHPLSLSPERIKIVNFFENHQAEFDFYGFYWPEGCSKNYKGTVTSKVECMQHYRFCFCYENTRDLSGYITGDKIFNVFVAGCVPIYWGAHNIKDYIPQNCFIDKRDFASYDELYQFLKGMTQKEYQSYIDNIKRFMASPQALRFSSENFIDIILEAVEPGYDKTVALTVGQRAVLEKIRGAGLATPR